ncbi:MAG: hypothetical protein ABI577_15050 [bacterium]
MVDEPHLSADDAVFLLNLLEAAGVRTWLEGGWGVDALIGVESRRHGDLDVFIECHTVPIARASLAAEGFAEVPGGRPENFVMKHGSREVDIHVFEFDEAGDGIYGMADGTEWVCPAAGLAGRGTILGRDVRCFTAELQLQCHSDYELDDDDLHDLALIRREFPGAEPLPLVVRQPQQGHFRPRR